MYPRKISKSNFLALGWFSSELAHLVLWSRLCQGKLQNCPDQTSENSQIAYRSECIREHIIILDLSLSTSRRFLFFIPTFHYGKNTVNQHIISWYFVSTRNRFNLAPIPPPPPLPPNFIKTNLIHVYTC